MKIIIYGNEEKRKELVNVLNISLEELGLTDFIKLEETNEDSVKEEMSIKEEPALIIEEETIDFKDMIFEGQIPPEEEIKAMLISIIGGEAGGGCGSTEEDGSCATGCSC